MFILKDVVLTEIIKFDDMIMFLMFSLPIIVYFVLKINGILVIILLIVIR